jgi:hypothetical protein
MHNVSDCVYKISYIFGGGPPPTPYPVCSGDWDCGCSVNITDAVACVSYVFGGGQPPFCTCEEWVDNCGPLHKGGEGSIGKSRSPWLRPSAEAAVVTLTGSADALDNRASALVSIDADEPIAGIQLIFQVSPRAVGDITPSTTERSENLELFYHLNDDLLRVGLIDMTGQHYLPPGAGPVVSLRMEAGSYQDLELVNVVLANPGARELEATIGKAEEPVSLPHQFNLSQNCPNPFNPTTEIAYALPEAAEISLEIFNVLGQRVRTLINGHQSAGWHRVSWDSCDEENQALPSGVYFYRLTAGDFSESKKMLLLK